VKTNLMLLAAILLLLSPALRADERLPANRSAEDAAPEVATPGDAAQATAHVVTVLVPALEDPSAHATVIRRPANPRNLILITEETTPREFLNALRALNRSRRDLGEAPADELRASIPAPTRGESPGERALASAAAHLSRVKAAPQRAIAGIGSYPALTTSLPALQR
jgi:hypothetical protein